jgi:site-specific DNA recombinase
MDVRSVQSVDDIFNALVEKITILSPARYLFTLKSGLEIEEFEE